MCVSAAVLLAVTYLPGAQCDAASLDLVTIHQFG